MWEILSILAGLFELLGIYLVGSKKIIGFVVAMIGNISWIIYSIGTQSAFGLIIVCMCALFLNGRAFRNWNK